MSVPHGGVGKTNLGSVAGGRSPPTIELRHPAAGGSRGRPCGKALPLAASPLPAPAPAHPSLPTATPAGPPGPPARPAAAVSRGQGPPPKKKGRQPPPPFSPSRCPPRWRRCSGQSRGGWSVALPPPNLRGPLHERGGGHGGGDAVGMGRGMLEAPTHGLGAPPPQHQEGKLRHGGVRDPPWGAAGTPQGCPHVTPSLCLLLLTAPGRVPPSERAGTAAMDTEGEPSTRDPRDPQDAELPEGTSAGEPPKAAPGHSEGLGRGVPTRHVPVALWGVGWGVLFGGPPVDLP